MAWLLPIAAIGAIWFFLMRRMQRAGPLSVGRNKARIYDETAQQRVNFTDVAGVDEAEAELVEVVDFLKNPERYFGSGAKIPRGALLAGEPGTGRRDRSGGGGGKACRCF